MQQTQDQGQPPVAEMQKVTISGAAPKQMQPGPTGPPAQQQQAPVQAQGARKKQGKPSEPQQKPAVGDVRLQAVGGALRPPRRNGQGNLGYKITLTANHFLVSIKSTYVYHYDVDINPQPPKALFK